LTVPTSPNSHPTAAALLAGLDSRPTDAPHLTALAQFYLEAATSDADRAALRDAAAARPALCAAFERFYREDTPERDPLRYFVLSLAMIALTDGQPSPRRARAALADLARFARDHGLDPQPYLAEVESIAGPRGARLFRAAQRAPGRRFALLLHALLLILLVGGALLLEAALPDPLRAVALALLLVAVGGGQLYLLYRRYG